MSAIDTIVAPATAFGRGALAIVRIDGPRSPAILEARRRQIPEERHAIPYFYMQGRRGAG